MPRPAAGTIVIRDGAMLALWRHRFITDSWGWEIPAGGIDPDERAVDAAVRETLEETGWRPAPPQHLCSFHPANGLLDQAFHIFVSTGAEYVGPPTDPNEAARIEWLATDRVRELFLAGAITDGLTFGALGFAFAAGAL